MTRDRQVESKPSTYCFVEIGDDVGAGVQGTSKPTMPPQGAPQGDPSMLRVPHPSMCFPPLSMSHAAIAYHAGMMGLLPPPFAPDRRLSPPELFELVQRAAFLHEMPPPQWSEPPAPPEGADGWNSDLSAVIAKTEAVTGQKRPSLELTVETLDPLCLTPPLAPSSTPAGKTCLSPFELEEKRPTKAPRSDVPLKPTASTEDLSLFGREPPILVNESEYADFVDCLLAM